MQAPKPPQNGWGNRPPARPTRHPKPPTLHVVVGSAPVHPAAVPASQPQYLSPPRRRRHRWSRALIIVIAGLAVGMIGTVIALSIGLFLMLSGGRTLPGVEVAGIPLGGLSKEEAFARLSASFDGLNFRDGERQWHLSLNQIQGTLDAASTVERALAYGRSTGSILNGIFGTAEVAPVIIFDPTGLITGLEGLGPQVNVPAQNATIRYEAGALVPVAAVEGRALDVGATAAKLVNLSATYHHGALDVVMTPVQPAVVDATPLLAKAQALLSSPLVIRAYNPVTNAVIDWQIPPQTWGVWLNTVNMPSGVSFTVSGAPLVDFLNTQNSALSGGQYLKPDEAMRAVQQAVEGGSAQAQVRLYNASTQYTVQPGDTLGSIAWKTGIQMFRISRANPGLNLETLGTGQVITLPSKDDLLPLPIVPNKRIVVSITRQRMWVYENGGVKWDWAASTGIADSPTQPGVYQILSHEGTAYAGNWNLHMPSFMSIYEAVPGFHNGIHGFPTRGGSQILWENSLGTRVTYGCILIDSANARILYDWAADGVVVEIQP